jgi:hypothetical protein
MQAACNTSEFGLTIYGSTGYTGLQGAPASTFSKVIVCEAGEAISLWVEMFSLTGNPYNTDFVAAGVTNWLTVTYQGA